MTTTAASGAASDAGAPHPVVGFARQLHEELDRAAEAVTWSMSSEEQAEALLALESARARLEGLWLRVMSQADRDGLGEGAGATSTAAWMASESRQTRAACSNAARLAERFDDDLTATGAALEAGQINLDQAKVIVAAVDRLTTDFDDLPPDIRKRAEAHLLELAGQYDAAILRRLGRRLFEVVCPEAADAAEADALAREEEKARRAASLSMRDNGDGTHEGRFRLPDLHAAVLRKVLQTLAAPRRTGEARLDPVTGKKRPYPALLGEAFLELLESLDPQKLPICAGGPFTVVVSMTLDALLGRLQAAGLETGERISPGQARRLACAAGVIPMVLGGRSVPLDLGRERRLYTKHQRIALAHRYHGCAEVSCDRPPAWVTIHHTTPWRHGGRTDLADGLPLCPAHHHLADHPERWDMRRLPSGAVRFHRRP